MTSKGKMKTKHLQILLIFYPDTALYKHHDVLQEPRRQSNYHARCECIQRISGSYNIASF